jgi:hypothetical protein
MIWITGARNEGLDKFACLQDTIAPLGLLVTPFTKSFTNIMHNYPHVAMDNGCFSQPKKFKLEKYLELITKVQQVRGGDCLFATAPDVVGDWFGTLVKSLPILPKIREAGGFAALIAQEGIEQVGLDNIPWDEFDCLFIGGEPKNDSWFKLGDAVKPIIKEAHRRNKWVHIGRVNGVPRIAQAYELGADSADGTFVKFKYGETFRGVPDVVEWLRLIRKKQTRSSMQWMGGLA